MIWKLSLVINLHYSALDPLQTQTHHKIVESKGTFKALAVRRVLGKGLHLATPTGFNSWACPVQLCDLGQDAEPLWASVSHFVK